MKYTTYAKIIFPLGIIYFLIVFSRFCILTVQAHQWNVLIMGASPTLALLAWFIGFYMTVKRQKPITQWDARAGVGFFLVISAIVLNYVTP